MLQNLRCEAGGSQKVRKWRSRYREVEEHVEPTGRDEASFPGSFAYLWNVPHFLSLSCHSMYSPTFTVNDHAWKIYIYPKGNNNNNKFLSIYLDSGITDNNASLECTFKLAVINYKVNARDAETAAAPGGPLNAAASVVKDSAHAFCSAPPTPAPPAAAPPAPAPRRAWVVGDAPEAWIEHLGASI